MLGRLKEALPPYFVEKFEGVDEKQIGALPDSIRSALIHGTDDEFKQALSDLWTRERLQGKRLLGEAAMEMIKDMRYIVNSVVKI
jgi:hypothetical protein